MMDKTIDVESQPQQAMTVRDTVGTVERLPNLEQPKAPELNWFELMKLSESLVTTGFLPVAIKTPAQAAAIILTGRELGLPPMQSLRSICIIQGKPELAADLQLSIFKRDGGKATWLALDTTQAKLWLRHPNGDEHTEVFSIQDARTAGLTGGNWHKYPKAMLRSRAITAGLKSLGFEPLTGCYAPGEIGGPEIVEHGPESTGAPSTPASAPSAKPEAPSAPSPATTPTAAAKPATAPAPTTKAGEEVFPGVTVLSIKEVHSKPDAKKKWVAFFVRFSDGVQEMEAATFDTNLAAFANELANTNESAILKTRPGNKPGTKEIISLERSDQPPATKEDDQIPMEFDKNGQPITENTP